MSSLTNLLNMYTLLYCYCTFLTCTISVIITWYWIRLTWYHFLPRRSLQHVQTPEADPRRTRCPHTGSGGPHQADRDGGGQKPQRRQCKSIWRPSSLYLPIPPQKSRTCSKVRDPEVHYYTRKDYGCFVYIVGMYHFVKNVFCAYRECDATCVCCTLTIQLV